MSDVRAIAVRREAIRAAKQAKTLPFPQYKPMSTEEQDYINSLERWLRPTAIYQLQTYNAARMADFINFLRNRHNSGPQIA